MTPERLAEIVALVGLDGSIIEYIDKLLAALDAAEKDNETLRARLGEAAAKHEIELNALAAFMTVQEEVNRRLARTNLELVHLLPDDVRAARRATPTDGTL